MWLGQRSAVPRAPLLLQGDLGLIAWPWSASVSSFLAGCLGPPRGVLGETSGTQQLKCSETCKAVACSSGLSVSLT